MQTLRVSAVTLNAPLDRLGSILEDFDAALLAKERSQPNDTLRTRRPELYGELVRDQNDKQR